MKPEFEKGDLVQFGRGTIPHKVVAVITTGNRSTYDLVSVGGLRKGRRHQGVIEKKLYPYEAPR